MVDFVLPLSGVNWLVPILVQMLRVQNGYPAGCRVFEILMKCE